MGIQEALALGVVIVTAGLFIAAARRRWNRRAPAGACGSDCACSGEHVQRKVESPEGKSYSYEETIR
jgi:hypothetical protein